MVTVALRPSTAEPLPLFVVVINNTPGFRMFLDTGATRTVLSPREAEQLGLTVGPGRVPIAGSQETPAGHARIHSLALDEPGTQVWDLSVRVLDLPIGDGALGLDYLSRFAKVCYDFESNMLELTTR